MNYRWGSLVTFVHIFKLYILLNLCVFVTKKLFFNKKMNPRNFSSTRKQTPVQEGVVMDIVKYYF